MNGKLEGILMDRGCSSAEAYELAEALSPELGKLLGDRLQEHTKTIKDLEKDLAEAQKENISLDQENEKLSETMDKLEDKETVDGLETRVSELEQELSDTKALNLTTIEGLTAHAKDLALERDILKEKAVTSDEDRAKVLIVDGITALLREVSRG